MPHGGKRIYGGKEWFGVWAKDTRRYIVSYKGKTYKVARLVCEAFHGPQPLPYPDSVVIHINENSRDNRAENLKWGSQKENLNCDGFKAYCRARLGDNSPSAKARRKRLSQKLSAACPKS